MCESLKIRENFSIVKYKWFNNENLNQNNACFCGASPGYLWATQEWEWINKVQSQLCITKIFSSWTIAGWLLGTHWMKLVPLDIVSMVKYLHGWCVVLKSDLDSQYGELESKFGDSIWNHLSEVWQFTFYYYMVYSQITVGNVIL